MSKFIRNSLSRLLSQAAGKLALFLWTMILARRLNPAGFGVYIYIFAVSSIIGIISDYGLGNLAIRDVAMAPAHSPRTLTHTLLLRTLLAALAYALFVALVFALPGFYEVKTAAILFGLTIFTVSWINGFNAILNAREELQWSSFMNALVPLLTLASGLLFLSLGWGLTGAVAGSLVAGVLVLGAESVLFRTKHIAFSKSIERDFLANLIRQGLPFFLVGILSTVNVSIDSVLLESLSGKEAVGFYNASFKLILALMILPAAISDAAFPLWLRDSADPSRTKRLSLLHILQLLLAAGALTAMLLYAVAAPLVHMVFGDNFAPSVPVLRLHAFALVFMYLSAPLMIRLFVADRLGYLIAAMAIVVAANIIGNLAIIPRHGFAGAAGLRLCTEALNFMLLSFFVWGAARFEEARPKRER